MLYFSSCFKVKKFEIVSFIILTLFKNDKFFKFALKMFIAC